jgi:enoyl-CoA hydratase
MTNVVRIAREGRIATITLDRGDGRNALSAAAMRELTKTAHMLAADPSLSAIVLTGAGGFSAGADLKDPEFANRLKLPLLERREALKLGPDLCDAWERIEAVTICAIERFCIGGAVSLAVSCDFRILADDAHLRLPEIPLGMNMSWRTLPRLLALIGPARTKKMTIFGERIEAAEAEMWGLVDRVVPKGQTLAAALEWAGRIARLPPVPVRMSKQAITAQAHAHAYATSYMDLDQYALAMEGEDHREAVKAFLEKREAVFKGN